MSNRQLFQVGELAESKSTIPGFRGAWFRCEILEVAWSKGHCKYRVRYYDYENDGDDIGWVKLYQRLPKGKRLQMLRPQYPPIYKECELPSINAITEVAVVVDGGWSIGDQVDWWEDDCYWSGTLTEVLGDDSEKDFKIKLPDKPIGEGLYCDVYSKDLRPSLDWSPGSGWIFPAPVGSQHGHAHARLVQPVKQATIPSESLVNVVDEINQKADATPRSSLDFDYSISSHTSECSLPLLKRLIRSKNLAKQSNELSGKENEQTHGENMELDAGGTAGKRSCSDSVSSTFVRGASVEVLAASSAEKQDHGDNAPAKKSRAYEAIPLNSTSCDSIESAIMDLEELVCRVKWLKQILKSEGPLTSMSKKWEFLEHPAVSAPK